MADREDVQPVEWINLKILQDGLVSGTFIKISVIACTIAILVGIIRFLFFCSEHAYMKSCSLPGFRARNVLLYLMVGKMFYRSPFPTLCIALQYLCGICKIFESDRIFRVYLGFKPLVFFFKAETVEVVLNNSKTSEKSTEYSFLHPWIGQGLFTSSGKKWRERRKLLTPTFHFSILEDFVPAFYEQSNVLVTKLQTLSEKPWVDIAPLISACTLDIICQTAMGVRIHSQLGGCTEYTQTIHDLGELLFYRILRPWLYPDIIFRLFPSGRRARDKLRYFHDFTKKMIKEKKASMMELSHEDSEATFASSGQTRKRRAFLELLLEYHAKDPSFTEDDIQEEVDTFMVAGNDTTGGTLNWSLYFLGQDKRVQKEVYDEIDSIFQGDIDREITREDLNRMKYLDCVVKETLRLHPSVPFMTRKVTESFQVLNYTVHKGSTCVILPFTLHYDKDVFPEPERFLPERFLPENSFGRHPYAYVPFSAGPRNCIGQKFSMLEAKMVLSNIMRHFQVTSLDPRDKVKIYPRPILKNVDPLRLRFTPRIQNPV